MSIIEEFPSTLHLFCTNHSGMGCEINIQQSVTTTSPPPLDSCDCGSFDFPPSGNLTINDSDHNLVHTQTASLGSEQRFITNINTINSSTYINSLSVNFSSYPVHISHVVEFVLKTLDETIIASRYVGVVDKVTSLSEPLVFNNIDSNIDLNGKVILLEVNSVCTKEKTLGCCDSMPSSITLEDELNELNLLVCETKNIFDDTITTTTTTEAPPDPPPPPEEDPDALNLPILRYNQTSQIWTGTSAFDPEGRGYGIARGLVGNLNSPYLPKFVGYMARVALDAGAISSNLQTTHGPSSTYWILPYIGQGAFSDFFDLRVRRKSIDTDWCGWATKSQPFGQMMTFEYKLEKKPSEDNELGFDFLSSDPLDPTFWDTPVKQSFLAGQAWTYDDIQTFHFPDSNRPEHAGGSDTCCFELYNYTDGGCANSNVLYLPHSYGNDFCGNVTSWDNTAISNLNHVNPELTRGGYYNRPINITGRDYSYDNNPNHDRGFISPFSNGRIRSISTRSTFNYRGPTSLIASIDAIIQVYLVRSRVHVAYRVGVGGVGSTSIHKVSNQPWLRSIFDVDYHVYRVQQVIHRPRTPWTDEIIW